MTRVSEQEWKERGKEGVGVSIFAPFLISSVSDEPTISHAERTQPKKMELLRHLATQTRKSKTENNQVR